MKVEMGVEMGVEMEVGMEVEVNDLYGSSHKPITVMRSCSCTAITHL